MKENVKLHCPSCGLAYDETSAYCSRCGYKLDVNDKKLLNWKWIFLSMIALIIFQILVLSSAYYIVYMAAGPEAFMRNILVIPYYAIPASALTGSFIFSIIFPRSSAVDLSAGIGLFLVFSNIVNFIFLDSFSLYSLAWIPVLSGLAYAGAWGGKKLRARIMKAST